MGKSDIIILLVAILILLVIMSWLLRSAVWSRIYVKLWKRNNHNLRLIHSYTNRQKIANNLAEALTHLSAKRIGSTILIERNQKVTDYVTLGAKINAEIDPYLIQTIFSKNTPLHDGGIIIRKNKIVYAACYFPLLQQKRAQDAIPLSYGSRHRATISITNITDAVCFVTSETTGKIVFTKNKKMFQISSNQSKLISFIMKCLSE